MTAKNLASGVNNLFKNENRDTVVEKYKRLIEKLKTNDITPIEALNILNDIKKKYNI